MEAIRNKPCLVISGICYAVLIVAAYLSFGSVLVHSGKSIQVHSTQGTAFVK